jgi:low affinity Fe/Cu permease
MVFLLQHTQNRDAIAMQLKLDALIEASEQASNRFIGLEGLTEEELQVIRSWFVRVARGYRPALAKNTAHLARALRWRFPVANRAVGNGS